MSPRADWKQDEREFAKWMGGKRFPSRGDAYHDIAGEWWTAESKSIGDGNNRTVATFLKRAFDQARVNAVSYADKLPFVVITLHQGKGNPKRRFLCIEVDFNQDEWEDIASELTTAATEE